MALSTSIQDWMVIDRCIFSLLLWSKKQNKVKYLEHDSSHLRQRREDESSFSYQWSSGEPSQGIQRVTRSTFIFKSSLQHEKDCFVAQRELNNCYRMWAWKRQKKTKPKKDKPKNKHNGMCLHRVNSSVLSLAKSRSQLLSSILHISGTAETDPACLSMRGRLQYMAGERGHCSRYLLLFA